MNKIYICLITSANNAQNLEWLNEASQYVDGIGAVWHGEKDEGYEILKNNKKNGFIIEREEFWHSGHSMNDFLLNPKIRPQSWIILRDSAEKCNLEWLKNIRNFIAQLEQNNINTVVQYSKILMFKKHEFQLFQNHPHWALAGAQPGFLAIETQKGYEDPKDYAFSVRNESRSKEHFLKHFLKYYLADSSNHMLLGRDNNMEDFKLHEQKRQEFKNYIENELNLACNIDSVHEYLSNYLTPAKMKEFLNFEQILNNYYRFYILNHKIDDIIKDNDKGILYKIV
jgi:hypothetical protein